MCVCGEGGREGLRQCKHICVCDSVEGPDALLVNVFILMCAHI